MALSRHRIVLVDRRDWRIVRSWDGVADAAADLEISKAAVYKHCLRKTVSPTSLHVIRYADDCKLADEPRDGTRSSLVLVTWLEDGTTYVFPSKTEAGRALLVSCTAIEHAIRRKRPIAGKYRVQLIPEGSAARKAER